ncbi:hypothetical protein BH11VER1_BH11VER1_14240 [soil metagenome]
MLPLQIRAVSVETAPLVIGREMHTATLLANGKVLVCGGSAAGGYTGSSELYDPGTGTWTTSGSLVKARHAHTATLLANGKILVAGGYAPSEDNSAELYDPNTGSWVTTGSMNFTHAFHAAVLLANGKVLAVGGYGTGGPRAELYDPDTGTWTAAGQMIENRAEHTATLLPNGKVLVVGVFENSDHPFEAELYDPSTGVWALTGFMISRGRLHTATLLPNGKVLVAGGESNVQLFDPVTESWAATGELNNGRFLHSASLLADGRVLVTGGFAGGDLKSSELYDPSTGTWTTTFPLVTARNRLSTTLLNNGKVLVTGGFNNSLSNPWLKTAELFDTLSPLAMFRVSSGLAANGSQDLHTPAGDGVANLLKYSFNMLGSESNQAPSIVTPNIALLTPESAAGLPLIELIPYNSLRISYIRRKASTLPGVSYAVEFSDDLSVNSWGINPDIVENITSLDSTFERVTMTDPTYAVSRFARVKVTVLP